MTLLISLAPTRTANAAVNINKTKATLYIGYTTKLSITSTDKYVMWSSNNKNVATVSKSGKVKGIKAGTAKITATVGTGSSKQKFYCNITVKSRLSAKTRNVIIQEDEYQEIVINWKNAEDDEMLICIPDYPYLASAEWVDSDSDYILRIIPEELGYGSVLVYTCTSKYEEDINYEDELKINVFVVNDLDWIPADDLYSSELIDEFDLLQTYYDTEDRDTPQIIYNKATISYKHIDFELYLNTNDLKNAGIL